MSTPRAARRSLSTSAFHLLCQKGHHQCWQSPAPSSVVLRRRGHLGKSLPLLCFQTHLYPTLIGCQIVQSSRLGLHKFSLAHGAPPSFAPSRFPFISVVVVAEVGGSGSQMPLDLQLPLRSYPPTFRCTEASEPPRCPGIMCRGPLFNHDVLLVVDQKRNKEE